MCIRDRYDLLATLNEITCQQKLKTDGISFLPELMGNTAKQQKHHYLYFEFPEKGGQVAIRCGKWKGVKSNMKKDKSAAWEIYNLAFDPKEEKNIAAQHPALAKRFEKMMRKEHMPAQLAEWEFILATDKK